MVETMNRPHLAELLVCMLHHMRSAHEETEGYRQFCFALLDLVHVAQRENRWLWENEFRRRNEAHEQRRAERTAAV